MTQSDQAQGQYAITGFFLPKTTYCNLANVLFRVRPALSNLPKILTLLDPRVDPTRVHP